MAGTPEAGGNLAGAVANDRALREMPVRVFVHVPKLAPGAECEVRVFRTSAEFAKTQSATYSVCAGGVSVEGRALPGYDAMRAKMQEQQKQPSARPGTVPPKKK